MHTNTSLTLLVVVLTGAILPRIHSYIVLGGIRRSTWRGGTVNPTSKPRPLKMSEEEYRGSNNWEGLLPSTEEPREWDEGFRSFLLRYGMLNHVVYDVFVKGQKDVTTEEGLSGTSRFKQDLDSFSAEGLRFRYLNKLGEEKMEYDFTEEYSIIANLVCSPRSFFAAEDNWFGFIALSADTKEMVIVFRGTETTKEWVENATLLMEQLDGEEPERGLALFWNRKDLMVHRGFQQLYRQESVQGLESPKQTIHRIVEEYKDSIEKITVVGHSLGGAMCQLCGIDLVQSGVSGDIPVTVIAWAAPKISNRAMGEHVKSLHPKLRILRILNRNDSIGDMPPPWLWSITCGGYVHLGTQLTVCNNDMKKRGVCKSEGGNSPNHNLEMHLHCIDPTRDIALMNKVGDVVPTDYAKAHGISASWHSQSWPRTLY